MMDTTQATDDRATHRALYEFACRASLTFEVMTKLLYQPSSRESMEQTHNAIVSTDWRAVTRLEPKT